MRKLDNMQDRLERNTETIEEIKNQTTITNGRVNALELDKARREGADSVVKTRDGSDWKRLAFQLIALFGVVFSAVGGAIALVVKVIE